jgi:nucleoside triphosphate diphosphatase
MKLERLVDIMTRLRDPQSGCPWDLEQTFATIAPYTIEEAYEVADAIARGSREELKDELGDLLFQVVFHAQMAREAGEFTIDDIVASICAKMIRRHPHVFGGQEIASAAEQSIAWEAHKRTERGDAGGQLDGIPLAFPALTRAAKLGRRAAAAGFDWREAADVVAKIDEEIAELRVAMQERADQASLEEELGDVLFSLVNLSRHLAIDPEHALRQANAKFERRFRALEVRVAAAGRRIGELTLEELDQLWNEVKRAERAGPRATGRRA